MEILCPHIHESNVPSKKILADLQQREIVEQYGKKTLRELAKEHGVSYETVRRVIKRVKSSYIT